MAITRAEALTGTQKQLEFFSDFPNSFAVTPFGGQLSRVTNVKSIEQSLKNIIKTNRDERFFQPFLGSDVYRSLFEPNDSLIESRLEFYIETAIKNCEPRVYLHSVDVEKSQTNEHEIIVTIIYNIINNSELLTLQAILKRIR